MDLIHQLHAVNHPTRKVPSQRGLLLTLFLVTPVGPNIPALQFALMSWWHTPDKVMWSFGLLWSSALTFIAIPLSIVLGGVWIPKATARAAVK